MLEPVEVTDMRLVAKASIVVYRDPLTGRLFLDPNLPEHPLFKLGEIKGDKGDTGAPGTNGTNGLPGAKGDTGAPGTNGTNGTNGLPGAKGDTGATGTNGTNGLPGAIGATGAAGIPGIKGDTGATGAIGATGAAGIQGIKGDTGAAGIQGIQGIKGDAGATGAVGATGAAGADGVDSNPAIKLTGSTLNTSRAGVVAGLTIQSVDSATPLIGSLVVFRGLLKLVSTATGTASMQANIGGLIFTFPNITLAVGTQYLNFEVTAHVLSAGVGFASIRQSIALNGVAANAVQSNNVAQSGASSTNTALIQFKSPVTTAVTTLFAVTEIL